VTEAEWLTATDPQRMLEVLWGKSSDADILGHCRQPGPHWGCWVVDLLLGKE